MIRQSPPELIQVGALQATHLSFDHALTAFNHPNWLDWSGRTGAYFCVADMFGKPMLISRIGTFSSDKPTEKYFRFCQEKAMRLASHPDHLSSFQSRDPEQNQWDGAIKTDYGVIFSMSGLPELGDEAVMLYAAYQLRLIKAENIEAILMLSLNACWDRLNSCYRILP